VPPAIPPGQQPPANPPGPLPAGDPHQPTPPNTTFTQADVDRIVQTRLQEDRDRRAREAQAEADRNAAEQLKKDGKLDELLALEKRRNDDLMARLERLEQTSLRDRIAGEFGLVGENAELGSALTGTSEAELRASAEKLARFKKTPTAPDLQQHQPGGRRPDPQAPPGASGYIDKTYKIPDLTKRG
jgi:hypothetical protein